MAQVVNPNVRDQLDAKFLCQAWDRINAQFSIRISNQAWTQTYHMAQTLISREVYWPIKAQAHLK
jgi:hypothetical protein